jgi:transcriptional regulator with XRE-family HTH domain
MALEELAILVGEAKGNPISVATLRNIESGMQRPGPSLFDALVAVLDLDPDEATAIIAAIEKPCSPECLHDGAMQRGEGDRHTDCERYAECLATFTGRDTQAMAAHCPPRCTLRRALPFYVRAGLDGGQHGDRRWDSVDGEPERDSVHAPPTRRPITEPPTSGVRLRVLNNDQQEKGAA